MITYHEKLVRDGIPEYLKKKKVSMLTIRF
jgi:hypothetical protein